MTPGLTPRELGILVPFFQKFPGISEARLFGSRAMGTHKPGSDVDIALVGRLPFGTVARLKAALEESPLPYTFDVVDYAGIETPAFKEHIDIHGKVIYKRP